MSIRNAGKIPTLIIKQEDKNLSDVSHDSSVDTFLQSRFWGPPRLIFNGHVGNKVA
jgi:hypothetical protein